MASDGQFVSHSLDVVSFDSSWQEERNVSEASAQTGSLEYSEVECQSLERNSIALQADLTKEVEYVENPDIPRIMDFIRRVEPMVVNVLEQNVRSKAFKDYQKRTAAQEDVGAINTHSLRDKEVGEGFQVLCIDWNSTGTTVAAGYGSSQHEDWCTHRGLITTWNIERRNLNPSKGDLRLDIDSCTSALKFNPREPGLLAVGSYTGQVTVFNLTLTEGNMIASYSPPGDQTHKEPVTCLQWHWKKSEQPCLVSAGYDGKIIIWTLPNRGQELSVSSALAVTIRSLPRALRGRVSNVEKETGLTGIAFSRKEPDLFLAVGETGAMLHCNMNTKDPVGSLGEHTLYNPVVLSLRPHRGPVYCVKESPFHRNIFVSCSADGLVRVNNILKIDALLSCPLAGYLYSVDWSPNRPLVFAAAGSAGIVFVYDLLFSKTTPATRIEATTDAAAVHTVAFNPHKADVLATGDAAGIIKIWKLGERFLSQIPGEETELNSLALTSQED